LTVITDELDRLIQSFIPIQKEIIQAMDELLTFHNAGEFLILFLATVIIASFAEEMLFRGFFQGTMERLTDVTKAVMSTALVFAVVHFNPWWFLEIVLFGVLIGVIVWKSGSIFPGIAVHALKNFLAMITTNAEPQNMSWYLLKEHVHPIWLILALGIIIIGFRLLYRFTEGEKLYKSA
jgi:membrane protease YdiL (CAAX protease family)